MVSDSRSIKGEKYSTLELMDFKFFERLSASQAQDYLEQYLRLGSQEMGPILTRCSNDGVEANYAVGSIPVFFKWVLPQLKVLPQQPDNSVPEWIKNTESYGKYLFDFDRRRRRRGHPLGR